MDNHALYYLSDIHLTCNNVQCTILKHINIIIINMTEQCIFSK